MDRAISAIYHLRSTLHSTLAPPTGPSDRHVSRRLSLRMAAQRLPTDEEMTKVVEAIESDLSNDEAVAKIVEITGWSRRTAAEWTLVARTGYYDEILDD